MSIISVEEIVTILKNNVDTEGLVDVISVVEKKFGVSTTRFRSALSLLEEEGYKLYLRPATQIGTGKKTFIKVLAPSDSKYKDTYDQSIHPIKETSGELTPEVVERAKARARAAIKKLEEASEEYTEAQAEVDRLAYLEHEKEIDDLKQKEENK
jgi:hypothetical protein